MNHRCLLLILVLCGFLAGGCANKPAAFQVDMVSDLVMMFPGADHKETQLNFTHTVVEKNESATLVEVRLDSIQASMKSLSIKLSYDSATDNGPIRPEEAGKQNRLEKYRQSFTGLAGLSYRANVNHAGGQATLLDLPQRLETIASGQVNGMFGGDQITMVLSRHSLRDYASVGLADATDKMWFEKGETVVPGVTHVNTQRSVDPQAQTNDPNKPGVTLWAFTLEQSGGSDAKTQADAAAAPPARTKQQGLQMKSFNGKGHIERSRKKNRLELWQENSTAHVQTSANRANTNKKPKPIFYRIKKTIQRTNP